MRTLLLLAFLVISIVVHGEEPHHTTAFMSPLHSSNTLVTYSRYATDHFWNKNGKKLPAFNRFRQDETLLYSEYVVTAKNSLFLHAGYSLIRESLNGNSHALQDGELGWKHSLWEDEESAIAFELIGIIPIGDKKSSVRYGKWGGEATLLISQLFWKEERMLWGDFGVGLRFYEGFPSDQLRSFLSLGFQLFPCVAIIATGDFTCGLFNGEGKKNFNNIAFNPNFRLLKAKIECDFTLHDHVALALGGYQHLWGQNVGAGGGYFCGAWIYF